MAQDYFSKISLDGKTALVTGAGRGIGKACALAMVQAGAKVIGVARTAADLEQLRKEAGSDLETWVADVTDHEFYQRVESLPRLDVLFNNAGTNRPQAFVEVTDDALETVIDINVRAMFCIARAAARVMVRDSTGGSIINMSSQMGHIGSPNRTVYCMTKHAVEGLTKAMAVELAEKQIRVNAVAPTFIETALVSPMLADPEFKAHVDRMIPLGKIGQPEDVASAVLYLASSASAMVTGHSLRIDGGWTAH